MHDGACADRSAHLPRAFRKMTAQSYLVLLIEDNPGDAALVEELLSQVEDVSFHLETVSRLDAGLKRLVEGGVDVVLLDLGLPDSQGLETLEKTYAVAPAVPILVMTGQDDSEVALQAVKKGAQDFIVKGKISSTGISRALRYAVERERSAKERQLQNAEIRMLTEQLPALLWTTDDQLRITSSLGAGLAGLGLRPGELVGKTLFEYVGTQDEDHPIIAMHRRALGGESVITELDWSRRKFHSRVEPLRPHGSHIVGVVGVALDVTDQRIAEEDFRAAAEIQQMLLPKSSPAAPDWDIAGVCEPAAATGGDYFDYITLRDGSLGIVVADVSKHGFAPALIMASTRRSLRDISTRETDLGSILSWANRALLEDTTEYFVTLFLARLDLSLRTLTYVGAGHEAYLFSPQGDMATLKSTSMPLGVADVEIEAHPTSFKLEPGAILLMMTDGLAEAMERGEGKAFGLDRIRELVKTHSAQPAKEIVQTLIQAVRQYCLPMAPHDDMTVVVAKVKGIA